MRDIVFAVDDRVVEPFLVTLHSLLTLGESPKESRLFVIHDDSLSGPYVERIRRFATQRDRSVSFVDATGHLESSLPLAPEDHVTRATFFRLYAASLLPSNVASVLYLDCDLLVRKSIRHLLEVPVTAAIAAVDHLTPVDGVRLYGPLGGTYFQAGVLILNLAAWRATDAEGTFQRILREQRHLIRWWDQDVLNLAFADAWQRLEIWNNVGFLAVQSFPEQDLHSHARIVHFDGAHKPWTVDKPRMFHDDWFRTYHEVFGTPFDKRRIRRPFGSRILSAAKRRLQRAVDAFQTVTR